MQFLIGVDCEGPACVVGQAGGSLNDSRNLDFARAQATREADAAARGLFEAGADRVIVWDNHGGSLNLHYEKLDERCEIALGNFPDRWPGLDSGFAGVLFVGYHAMDNTAAAPMAHTFSSKAFQWQSINAQQVGELAVDGALAGELGVPPIFVSSDDKALAEAKRFFPWIESVQTKQGYGWNAAVSLHPNRSVERIFLGVQQAVARRSEMQPFSFDTPITVRRRMKRLEAAEHMAHSEGGWSAVDPYTVEKHAERVSDIF